MSVSPSLSPLPRSQQASRVDSRIVLGILSGSAEEVFTSMHEAAVAVQDNAEARGGRRPVDRPVYVEIPGECSHRQPYAPYRDLKLTPFMPSCFRCFLVRWTILPPCIEYKSECLLRSNILAKPDQRRPSGSLRQHRYVLAFVNHVSSTAAKRPIPTDHGYCVGCLLIHAIRVLSLS